jgi:hypothetical protein
MPLWTPLFLSRSVVTAGLNINAVTGLSDGTGIGTASDVTGNGNTFTQATGINRPLYRTNQINGLPAAQFVSSDSLGSAVSASLLTEGFVAVISRDVSSGLDSIISPVSSGGRLLQVLAANTLRALKDPSTVIGTTTGTIGNTPTIISMILGPTSWELGINGTIESGSHAQTFTAGLTTTVGEAGGAGNGFEGLMPEAWFFDGLTATVRQLTEGYLAWRYGLQANLPGGHPYKTAAPVVARSGVVAVV